MTIPIARSSRPHAAAAAALVAGGALAFVSLASGCDTEGCLRGDEGCEVPSACQQVTFECADAAVEVLVISDVSQVPGGLDAQGAVGDILMRNSRVEAVIDAIEHPSHLAPTGGALLDLANRDRDDDAINHIFQAVGALPDEAVAYTRSRIIEGEGFVAVQVEGHLVGDERQRVYTRYEVRACEPGVRVRTEMVNGGDDTIVWSNADGYWWGSRSMVPFTPTPGEGYFHPSFGLGTLNDAFREKPFLIGASHSDPASAIATVPCNVPSVHGFHGGQVSATGTARRIVAPRDYEIYERFIAVRPGAGASPGVDIALVLREQIFDEPFATVSGKVELDGGRASAVGDHARAAVMISEGTLEDPVEARTPWTEVVPRADGTFEANVPANRTYVVDVVAFGLVVASKQLDVGVANADAGAINVPAASTISISAFVDGQPDHAQVFVVPDDDDTAAAVGARYFTLGPVCAPLIGPPFGGSPACDRVLVSPDAPALFDVPPGRYRLYATAGLFATVASEVVDLDPGATADVEFTLTRLERPGGTLGADFHVHGAASFDSTIPDDDRVRAFLAAGVDVIAATDHDAVWDYAEAMARLDANERMVLITGVETTGQQLFKLNPSVYFPQVIGHWIFWPVPFDPEAPRHGAPFDEGVEPGALMGRAAERGWDVADGVMQLNHPWSGAEFGRDLGFPRAIGVDLTREVPRFFDGTGPSLFFHTPEGSAFNNADYHVQEVMNGTNNGDVLAFRALWHWQLDQGIVRAGTANSDSHSLVDNVLGTPRNIVFTSTTLDDFDQATFNADVRAGRMIGTNGPIIQLTVVSNDELFGIGTAPIAVGDDDDAELRVQVSAPAWVPIREVRILVNGAETMVVVPEAELVHPADPFAAVTSTRLNRTFLLRELLPAGRRDAWIVVEAGEPLPRTGDLDCDGVPDTSDNNGDSEVDFRDVDRDGNGVVDEADTAKVTAPETCRDDYGASPDIDRPGTGPLRGPPAPPRDDANFAFYAVTPGGFPFAFTNPVLLDVDGDGTFEGPGL